MQRTEILRGFLEQSAEVAGRDFFRRRRRGDLALADLLEPQRMTKIFTDYGRRFGLDAPVAAVAGEWSKRYFAKVMKPVATAAIMLDWRLPFSPDDISIDVSEEGDILSLGLSSFGGPVVIGSAEERFDFLFRGNIAAVVHAVAQASGLSRNVLWSNAGNVFEGLARSRDMASLPPVRGPSDATTLLEMPVLSDGARNPLFRPIVYPVQCGQPKRQRRVCCIRYLLERMDYCATCPCPGRL